MSKTIEAIAVGTRRSGQHFKSRLRNLSQLDDLITPANAREWQSSLKETFTSESAFNLIMEDMLRLDTEVSEALITEPSSFSSSSFLSKQTQYQEYVDAFISIFAQSMKKGFKDHPVTEALKYHKCPTLNLFRRLVINPNLVVCADEGKEYSENQEVWVSETSKLPIIQLATFCDVAILRFLCNVTEKTDTHAIVWALEYIAEMTKRLEKSLRSQSELGWNGVSFRKRKNTIRNSTTELPKLAIDGKPIVIGVGSVDSDTTNMGTGPTGSNINPETGQPTLPRVPSIAVSEHDDDVVSNNVRCMSPDSSSLELSSISPDIPLKLNEIQSDGRDSSTNMSPSFKDESNSGRNRSVEEFISRAPRRKHSLTTSTPPSTKDLYDKPVRRVSTESRPFGLSSHPPPTRKSSVQTAVTAIVESIDEDETETSEAKVDPLLSTNSPRRRGLSQPVTPVLSVSSLDFRSRSPTRSPSPSNLLESRKSPPIEDQNEVKSKIELNDLSEVETVDEDEPPVKSKTQDPKNVYQYSNPLTDKRTPDKVNEELQTLVTHEGRISLLAILNAILHLPSNPNLWTEDSWDACRKCFSLIQFCMDFGLDAPKKDSSSDVISQYNKSSTNLQLLKSTQTYTRLVLKYAVRALIHCAVSTYTGCLSDSCPISTFILQRTTSRTASQNLNKMIHQLERLYSNSSLLFREAVMEFARHSPLKKVFHFLHVILQYCPRGTGRDPLDPASSRRDPLIVLTATVLRIIIDRLALLDLNEIAIQQSIVRESVSFVHFAITLFNQDFLRTKGFQHLQQYVNRVALSILLPIRQSPVSSSSSSSVFPPLDIPQMGTFPRKKDKNKGTKDTGDDTPRRKRGQTINIPDKFVEGSQSPFSNRKSPRAGRKGNLTKQSSLHKEPDTLTSQPLKLEHPVVSILKEEWRGLKIGVLHQRIRRLSVIMELSEPGHIPDPALLASLISVGGHGSLIPRVLVFLECIMFVQRLNKGELTTWMKNQPSIASWDLFYLMRKWGDAVGEALSACEITEKELFAQIKSKNDKQKEKSVKSISEQDDVDIQIAEEPVFPDEERDSDKRYIVNYALKMVACVLLLEITKFLREPPPLFLPIHHPAYLRHSPSVISQERKASNISTMSSDSDTLSVTHDRYMKRRGSSEHRKGSSPLLEDVPKFLSAEQPSSPSLLPRKESVYLRVNNSRYGRQTRAHTQGTSRKPPQSSSIEIPSETYRFSGNTSPIKSARRMSMSATALLQRQASQPESQHNTSIRHHARPSVAFLQDSAIKRRKSFSGTPVRNFRKENSPNLTYQPNSYTHGPTFTRQSSANQRIPSSPQSQRHLPSAFSRFLQRGRHIAVRHRPTRTESAVRKHPSITTSSPGSSPGSRRRISRSQSEQQDVAQYNQALEDIRTNFPWLDVVEHITTSFYFVSSELRAHRRQSCGELMIALKHIFAVKFKPQKRGVSDATLKNPQSNTFPRTQSRTSIGTVFSDSVFVTLPGTPIHVRGGSIMSSTRTTGSINRRTAPSQSSTDQLSQGLAKLDFSGVRLRFLLECGEWRMDEGDGDGEKEEEEEDISIDHLLETDFSQSLETLLDKFNDARLDYISSIFAGLLHAPFSLLTYAAPVLQSSTFKDLQDPAWIALCDQDYEYADAAASFFLLSCIKEKESIQAFLERKAKVSHLTTAKNAVLRFGVLWRCRDLVWPRMEQSAPKLFKLDEETNDAIGYSLPSQLLGTPGEALPHAPWKPSSVCVHDHSTDNSSKAKCYQSTKHAPLEHLSDVAINTRPYQVSGVSVTQMEVDSTPAVGASSALVELDRDDYEQGIISIKEIHKFPTLFPNDLLPLITLVIRALNPPNIYVTTQTDTDTQVIIPTVTQVSNAAEHFLWQCMLENPHNLFSPLLNQFNVLYQVIKDQKKKTIEESPEELLDDILQPFHILLTHFPTIPPRTAHYLFNHFIGIIMRHTEQPVGMSDIIIHSVLTLIGKVIPSVHGLSMKELKNQLKKESCYTTILTTARIRGVEKIRLTYPDMPDADPEDISIKEEGMTFVLLIAKDRNIDPETDLLSAFHSYYLTEEKRPDIPILSSLVIQDHYAIKPDGTLPTFALHETLGSHSVVWSKQLQLLHVHKMNEIARVLLASEMLNIEHPGTEIQQKYVQPDPTFIFSELQGLSSFPRKTLASLPYEMGPVGLQKLYLRSADIMLRGVWSKFILNLFTQMKDCETNDNMILFLTVINGSLLLQAEDHATLRYALAALLTAAQKFQSIFRSNAYQMVVPTLVQVYSLHQKNRMVKDVIKFIWTRFYWLNENVFLLQAIVSVANLFSSDVSALASLLKVNYSPLSIDWISDEQHLLVKATMELMKTLECGSFTLPTDTMDILSACPECVSNHFKTNPWTHCTLDQIMVSCVTVASFNPVVLRGMQVLVFLDHIITPLMKEYKSKDQFQTIVSSIRSLIKGCEALKRTLVLKGVSPRKGTSGAGAVITSGVNIEQQDSKHPRIASYVKQMFFFRNRSGTSQDLSVPRERSVSELPTNEQYAKYIAGFRSRHLGDVNQEIIQISRSALLSISGQLFSEATDNGDSITSVRRIFDIPSLMNICSITDKILRQGSKLYQDHMLVCSGITAVFKDIVPKVEWNADNISAFSTVLERIVKLFKKLQAESMRERLILTPHVWSCMLVFIRSLTQCIHNHPGIISDHEQLMFKIKSILEICLTIKLPTSHSTSTSSSSKNKIPPPQTFIFEAPLDFTMSLVNLCAEVIAVTSHGRNRKYRILLSTLFNGKLHFKDSESNFVWRRLFLPLAVDLGLRATSYFLNEEDITFILHIIWEMRDQIHFVIKYRSPHNRIQIWRFFLDLKVLLCAYGDSFTLEQWVNVGHAILTLATKFDSNSIRFTDLNEETNEVYITFCSNFLNFMESFLLLSRQPVFSVIWHVLFVIEQQLSKIRKNFDFQSNPSLSETLNYCLKKSASLKENSTLFPVSLSKQEMLLTMQNEFLPELQLQREKENVQTESITAQSKYPKARTPQTPGGFIGFGQPLEDPQMSGVGKPQPVKRRNSSKVPTFPVIVEGGETDAALSSPDHDTTHTFGLEEQKHTSESKVAHERPKTLAFKPSEVVNSTQERKNKGGLRGSPNVAKIKQMVSFSDKPTSSTPSKKLFGGKGSLKKKLITPEEDETYELKPMPPNRRKVARHERDRFARKKVESSFDADEEDASIDTPRTSFSYPSHTWPLEQDIELSECNPVIDLSTDREESETAITVLAEVHPSLMESSDYTSSKNNLPEVEKIKSVDELVSENPTVSTQFVSQNTTDVSSVSKNLRPMRPLLKRVTSIHSDPDEPDEQTGQLKHERNRTTQMVLEDERTRDSSRTPPPPTAKKPQGRNQSRIHYETGLKEAAPFLSSSVKDDEWSPPDDDFNV